MCLVLQQKPPSLAHFCTKANPDSNKGLLLWSTLCHTRNQNLNDLAIHSGLHISIIILSFVILFFAVTFTSVTKT